MLASHQILSQMPEAFACDLIQHLHEKEKPLYKAALAALAQKRKLRSVFIERKPRTEQHRWVREQLSHPSNDSLAAQTLQIWLVSAHKGLLCEFLDGLGISHDENGTVEELPGAPEKERLAGVIELLLGKHPATLVTVYLHAFQSISEAGWNSLEEILAEDPRLAL